MFEVDEVKPDRTRHFALIVRDDRQATEVREKVTKKYGLKLEPKFRLFTPLPHLVKKRNDSSLARNPKRDGVDASGGAGRR